ncbi:MAG: hypothetical protein JOZ33_06440 [Acidobacteriaceae bacterium]|nr:hypothetical protein [Acidobacteriaceae bacterium]
MYFLAHIRARESLSCEAFSTFKQLLRKTAEIVGNVRPANNVMQSFAHHRQYIMEFFGQVLF